MIEKLTKTQRERVKRLERALKVASSNGDLELAKRVVIDLQKIYLSTGNEAKMMQAKVRLYEAYMEAGSLQYSEDGLIGIRQRVNKNTRTFLEATALLAICYLRMKEIIKAKPLIREVLVNDKVIKSQEKRKRFRVGIIERFDEEGLLFTLIDENYVEKLDAAEIEKEAVELIRTNFSEEELYENIGKIVPNNAKNVLVSIDEFAKKQLPSAERIALPSSIQMVEDKRVGKTLFSSIKRVVYKSICDKDSEIYKSWYSNGLTTFTSLVSVIVSEALKNISIGAKAIIATVAALIVKFGLAVYCEHYKPLDIMELR